MLLETIILTSMARIENNRTLSAVYYLLVGKRSIQTVQDAYMYEIDQFYGVISNLNKHDFDKIIVKLTEEKLLIEGLNNTYLFSSRGDKWLSDQMTNGILHYFNGIKYNENDQIFYSRLLLMIQVLTNRKMKHSTYIPVIDETPITNWVVNAYQSLKHNVNGSLKHIYEELFQVLSYFSTIEASLFVNRITGYQTYGMSLSQLSKLYQIDKYDIQLMLTGITHQMMTLIRNNEKDFQYLNLFMTDMSNTRFISQSATQTKEVLNKGYDLRTISRIRKLRINTIYDHIVEIALADSSFAIDPYVTSAEQERILKAYKQTSSTKLKVLKNSVGEDISYFQIRLVLATSQSI